MKVVLEIKRYWLCSFNYFDGILSISHNLFIHFQGIVKNTPLFNRFYPKLAITISAF